LGINQNGIQVKLTPLVLSSYIRPHRDPDLRD